MALMAAFMFCNYEFWKIFCVLVFVTDIVQPYDKFLRRYFEVVQQFHTLKFTLHLRMLSKSGVLVKCHPTIIVLNDVVLVTKRVFC